MFKSFVKTDKSGVQLLLRMALAVVVFPHGAQKVLGWFGGPGLEKTMGVFSETGFPIWATVALMATELIGSMLLAVGYLTRLWALLIGIVITLCMFVYHIEHGFFMNWLGQQKGEGFEYHILALAIAFALLIRGGGALSIDRQLGSRGQRHRFTV